MAISPAGLAVEEQVLEAAAPHGVVHHAKGVACPRMVADEENGGEGLVQPFHHAAALHHALDHLGARVEVFHEQVAHLGMGVVHQHLRGAALVGAGDGGVDVGGHQPAGALILTRTDDRIIPVHNTGNTFDICRDKYFHHKPHIDLEFRGVRAYAHP